MSWRFACFPSNILYAEQRMDAENPTQTKLKLWKIWWGERGFLYKAKSIREEIVCLWEIVRMVYIYSLENLFKHFMSSVNYTKLQYTYDREHNIIHIEHFHNTLWIGYSVLSIRIRRAKCKQSIIQGLFLKYTIVNNLLYLWIIKRGNAAFFTSAITGAEEYIVFIIFIHLQYFYFYFIFYKINTGNVSFEGKMSRVSYISNSLFSLTEPQFKDSRHRSKPMEKIKLIYFGMYLGWDLNIIFFILFA